MPASINSSAEALWQIAAGSSDEWAVEKARYALSNDPPATPGGMTDTKREAELVSAICRIYRADVYENRDKDQGVSVELTGAIIEAAKAAGLVEDQTEAAYDKGVEDGRAAVLNSVPTPAEALGGANHPTSATVCIRHRGHSGSHWWKCGDPWYFDSSPGYAALPPRGTL
jgi:hypothetical protein